MPTNLNIDDELIRSVQEMGGFKTKREAVTAALEEFLSRRKQARIIELFGTIEYEEGWDPRILRGKAPLPENQEYLWPREQRSVSELFGTIEYDEGYDYKAARTGRTAPEHVESE